MKNFAVIGISILSVCFSQLFPSPAGAETETAGQQKSIACQGCHGPDGNSLGPDWPHLASQHSSYLSKQIRNFRDGARKNDTMNAMAAGLTDEDIRDIAGYFAGQVIQPQKEDINSDILKTGRKIYKGGNAYSGVPACAGCHGPNGTGNSLAIFPRIAGQRQTYLVKTLNDFKTGVRNNDVNEIMRNIASRLTENEIIAVSAYVATLNVVLDNSSASANTATENTTE